MTERGNYRPPGSESEKGMTRRDFLLHTLALGAAAAGIGRLGRRETEGRLTEPPADLSVDTTPLPHIPEMEGQKESVNAYPPAAPRDKSKDTGHKGEPRAPQKHKDAPKGKHDTHKQKQKRKPHKKEYLRGGRWAYVLEDELHELIEDLPDTEHSDALANFMDKVCEFEDAKAVASRLGNDARGAMARRYFERLLRASDVYLAALKSAAEEHQVPFEILLSVFAIEGAGRQADKNWFQFGPDSARANGLAVDAARGIDERTNLVKSARAAGRYIKKLYTEFGEQWGLALSAYNGGAERLRKILSEQFNVAHLHKYESDFFERQGINALTVYEKFTDRLMKGSSADRFMLRAAWYPFAASALGAHAWEVMCEQDRSAKKT